MDLKSCLMVRRAMDAGVVEEAEVLGDGIQRDDAVRRAVLIEPPPAIITDIETRLDACQADVAAFLEVQLGPREGAGFIRYYAGGFYGPHRDRGEEGAWVPAANRSVALVTFLNSSRDTVVDGDFQGGVLRLIFRDQVIDVAPEAGLLVAFHADVLHEVTEVRGGSRDVIVDWFSKRR